MLATQSEAAPSGAASTRAAVGIPVKAYPPSSIANPNEEPNLRSAEEVHSNVAPTDPATSQREAAILNQTPEHQTASSTLLANEDVHKEPPVDSAAPADLPQTSPSQSSLRPVTRSKYSPFGDADEKWRGVIKPNIIFFGENLPEKFYRKLAR